MAFQKNLESLGYHTIQDAFFGMTAVSASQHGWTRFVSMLPLCRDQGIAVIPWSPLSRGLLARKPAAETEHANTDAFAKRRYTRENDLATANAVSAVAEARGLTTAVVALAWMLSKPVVTASIVVAIKLGHLEDAVAALEVTLSDEEIR